MPIEEVFDKANMPPEPPSLPRDDERTCSVAEGGVNATTHYPVCLSVAGKRCVVLGGGEVAERKVLALLQAGARVVVVSPELTPQLNHLRGEGQLEYVPRTYRLGDLEQAFLAIAATDDYATNRAVVEEARQCQVLVNVVDDPSSGNFILPAVLRRGDLLITVSTGGRSPALARYVRDELETLLAPEHVTLLEIMADVRTELSARGQPVPGEVWRLALDGELLTLVERGHLELARARLLATLTDQNAGGPDVSAS